MAKTPGSPVAIQGSVTTWVFSTWTPVPSRPRSSTLPTMPTAEITRSTVSSRVSPPASMVAVTWSLPLFRDLTAAPVRIFMPCFSKALWAKAEISSSSTGRMRGRISTTVTSAPMVW